MGMLTSPRGSIPIFDGSSSRLTCTGSIISIVVNETNSNFGFNLPWWDRLLGTYRDQPAAGHEGMAIGVEQFREARELWLDRMLLQPFRGAAGAYAITWRSAA